MAIVPPSRLWAFVLAVPSPGGLPFTILGALSQPLTPVGEALMPRPRRRFGGAGLSGLPVSPTPPRPALPWGCSEHPVPRFRA